MRSLKQVIDTYCNSADTFADAAEAHGVPNVLHIYQSRFAAAGVDPPRSTKVKTVLFSLDPKNPDVNNQVIYCSMMNLCHYMWEHHTSLVVCKVFKAANAAAYGAWTDQVRNECAVKCKNLMDAILRRKPMMKRWKWREWFAWAISYGQIAAVNALSVAGFDGWANVNYRSSFTALQYEWTLTNLRKVLEMNHVAQVVNQQAEQQAQVVANANGANMPPQGGPAADQQRPAAQ